MKLESHSSNRIQDARIGAHILAWQRRDADSVQSFMLIVAVEFDFEVVNGFDFVRFQNVADGAGSSLSAASKPTELTQATSEMILTVSD